MTKFGLTLLVFLCGLVSPVILDSSSSKSFDSTNRRSAGTRSPAFKMTISPVTISAAKTSCSTLDRTIRDFGGINFVNFSRAFSDRCSCIKPTETTIMRAFMCSILIFHSSYTKMPSFATMIMNSSYTD